MTWSIDQENKWGDRIFTVRDRVNTFVNVKSRDNVPRPVILSTRHRLPDTGDAGWVLGGPPLGNVNFLITRGMGKDLNTQDAPVGLMPPVLVYVISSLFVTATCVTPNGFDLEIIASPMDSLNMQDLINSLVPATGPIPSEFPTNVSAIRVAANVAAQVAFNARNRRSFKLTNHAATDMAIGCGYTPSFAAGNERGIVLPGGLNATYVDDHQWSGNVQIIWSGADAAGEAIGDETF